MMNKYKRVGLTRGEYGKPGYMHATVKMTDEQDKEIAKMIQDHLKETGEEYISNNDHWQIAMEVLKETRGKD
jgi:glutamate synthase domain-containing protein 3